MMNTEHGNIQLLTCKTQGTNSTSLCFKHNMLHCKSKKAQVSPCDFEKKKIFCLKKNVAASMQENQIS